MIMGGATFGRNEGDIYGGGSDLNNPNFAFRRGVLGTDVPRIFKASGLYELPYAISLSGSIQYYTGQPERTTVSVGTDSATLTQVTQVDHRRPAGDDSTPIGHDDRHELQESIQVQQSFYRACARHFQYRQHQHDNQPLDSAGAGIRPRVKHHPGPDGQVRIEREVLRKT